MLIEPSVGDTAGAVLGVNTFETGRYAWLALTSRIGVLAVNAGGGTCVEDRIEIDEGVGSISA